MINREPVNVLRAIKELGCWSATHLRGLVTFLDEACVHPGIVLAEEGCPGGIPGLAENARNLLRKFRIPSLIVLVVFLATFGIIRAVTFMIRVGVGPFHNVSAGGLHIHHMVWGILILLAVGYIWLVPLGQVETPIPRWVSCATACVYGIGAALTLDEFALWLNFRDAYWERQGIESVDAAALFVALVAISIWGGPLVAELTSDLLRKLRVRMHFRPMREPAA